MLRTRALVRFALAFLAETALACGAEPDSATDRVTADELTAYLDWHAEFRNATRVARAEAVAAVARTTDLRERLAVQERNDARIAPIAGREPLAGTRKGSAIRAVLEVFYSTGKFTRDESALVGLRASYGAEIIDSIADQEPLFREKLP